MRHTPAGGSVRITLDGAADGVRVQVADNGAGIAAADLPHVFDRHWHGAASARGTTGRGLGLAIARRVELHGARIEVESANPRGTCFTFFVPTAGPPAPA